MSDVRPKLEQTVEKIFPKTAKEWLEYNTHNRKVSQRLVSVYAEAIAAGEWVLNGEPIIFDREGRLQSGQHRLLAVIEAGVPIWSCVVRGAEPDHLYTLDSGRKRRFADALTLAGEKNVAILSAVVTWSWRYEHKLMDRPSIVPTTSHLLHYLDDHSCLRNDVRAASPLKMALGISNGLYGALYHILSGVDAGDCDTFFSTLASGENLDSDNAIFALRRWIIRSKHSDRRPSMPVYAAVTIKAWNAWREHSPLRAVRWAANEAFPEPI